MTPGLQPAPAVLWHLGLPAGLFAHWAPKARMVPRRTAKSSVIFSTSQVSGSLVRVSPVSGVPEAQPAPSSRVCSPALATPGHRCWGRGVGWGLGQTCQLPAVFLGAARLGRDWAPKRAALWTGPRHQQAAVWNPALPPRRNPVLPLALWATLGGGPRWWLHPLVSTGHGPSAAAWEELEAESDLQARRGHRRCGPRGWPPPVQCTASVARSPGCWTRERSQRGRLGVEEAVAWRPGFWKAEVGQAHLSRSTTPLVVVLPPRVVFLLFLT